MAHGLVEAASVLNAKADAACALLNGGTIEVYDGSKPAGPGTAITTQNKLTTMTFGSPAFGSAVAGVATANAITAGTGTAAAGTGVVPTWARLKSSGGTALMDITVGANGATPYDLVLAAAAIVQNGTVTCSSLTYTQPLARGPLGSPWRSSSQTAFPTRPQRPEPERSPWRAALRLGTGRSGPSVRTAIVFHTPFMRAASGRRGSGRMPQAAPRLRVRV